MGNEDSADKSKKTIPVKGKDTPKKKTAIPKVQDATKAKSNMNALESKKLPAEKKPTDVKSSDKKENNAKESEKNKTKTANKKPTTSAEKVGDAGLKAKPQVGSAKATASKNVSNKNVKQSQKEGEKNKSAKDDNRKQQTKADKKNAKTKGAAHDSLDTNKIQPVETTKAS